MYPPEERQIFDEPPDFVKIMAISDHILVLQVAIPHGASMAKSCRRRWK